MIRLVILILLAIGTGLVSLLCFSGPTSFQNDVDVVDRCLELLQTPWVLTTIFVVFTVILVLHHIGGASVNDPDKPSKNYLSPKEAAVLQACIRTHDVKQQLGKPGMKEYQAASHV